MERMRPSLLCDRAEPQRSFVRSRAGHLAPARPERNPSPPSRPAERCRLCDRVRLCLAVDGVWLHPHFRPDGVGSAVAQAMAYPAPPPVGAESTLCDSLLRARAGPVRYRKKLAAAERALAPPLPSLALFCGALSARSSICACLACNTPAPSRAIQANQPRQRSMCVET